MNLFLGEVVETFCNDGNLLARVRIRGAFIVVAVALTPDARPGDTVVICDGVALSRLQDEPITIEEE